MVERRTCDQEVVGVDGADHNDEDEMMMTNRPDNDVHSAGLACRPISPVIHSWRML